MRHKLFVFILAIIFCCPVLAFAKTVKAKEDSVKQEKSDPHACCKISRIGGWMNYTPRKRSPKKEINASKKLTEETSEARVSNINLSDTERRDD